MKNKNAHHHYFQIWYCMQIYPKVPGASKLSNVNVKSCKKVKFNTPSQCDVWEGPSGVGGGAPGAPPLLSWLWSKFLLKNHVSLMAGIKSN